MVQESYCEKCFYLHCGESEGYCYMFIERPESLHCAKYTPEIEYTKKEEKDG